MIVYTSAASPLLPVVCIYEPRPTSLEWILDNQELEDGYAFVMSPKDICRVEKAFDQKTGRRYRKITHLA